MSAGSVKLSDYVARFLVEQGVKHVFAVAGGASLHLIDSIARTPGIHYVCPQHEQAGAMAADAYARVSRRLGVAVTTSGPGATNLATGVCCSYFDSVPVLFITGQVTTFRLRKDTGVRQLGFQETDVVQMFRPITKYAVQVQAPERIRYELEKACFIAFQGRPGPVLLDLPDDLQRAEVCPDELQSFRPPKSLRNSAALEPLAARCLELVRAARRPVLIVGWGVRLAGADAEARKAVESLGVPVLPTWPMLDLFPFDHPLLVGPFGTHGTRYGNFAVQNSDLVMSVGARLDTREAGSPLTTFARNARKVVVDIDPNELRKFPRFGLTPEELVEADAKQFFEALNRAQEGAPPVEVSEWRAQIKRWQETFPICPDAYHCEAEVNPYVFVRKLSDAAREREVLCLDTGCALAWVMQGFRFKEGQRAYHAFNNTPMGYALPSAIGASFALERARVICVAGDGSLQMNLQELATVIRHSLPIKIFLINNGGYSMIRQTQDQWLESRYEASTVDGGLAFPNFQKLALAYGYPTFSVDRNSDLDAIIRQVLETPGPAFCDVKISAQHRVIPQVKFGRPIEDAEPLLDRAIFRANMLVDPLPVSLD